MATSTINISMPEKWRDFVEMRVSEKGFGSVSEYFRDLLRQDRQNRINWINYASRPHPAASQSTPGPIVSEKPPPR